MFHSLSSFAILIFPLLGYTPYPDTPRSIQDGCNMLRHINNTCLYTLWSFNIAMENGPSIDGLPIKNGDVPWLC